MNLASQTPCTNHQTNLYKIVFLLSVSDHDQQPKYQFYLRGYYGQLETLWNDCTFGVFKNGWMCGQLETLWNDCTFGVLKNGWMCAQSKTLYNDCTFGV